MKGARRASKYHDLWDEIHREGGMSIYDDLDKLDQILDRSNRREQKVSHYCPQCGTCYYRSGKCDWCAPTVTLRVLVPTLEREDDK